MFVAVNLVMCGRSCEQDFSLSNVLIDRCEEHGSVLDMPIVRLEDVSSFRVRGERDCGTFPALNEG